MHLITLGSCSLPRDRLPDIEGVVILDDVSSLTAGRRRMRRRTRSRGQHCLAVLLKGEKNPLVVARSRSRKEIKAKLKRVTRVINNEFAMSADQVDNRISSIEERLREVYHAPGMPGYLRAQADWFADGGGDNVHMGPYIHVTGPCES